MENNKKNEKAINNRFTKKIGKTTSSSSSPCFSETSKETLQDKINHLIKNECSDMGS